MSAFVDALRHLRYPHNWTLTGGIPDSREAFEKRFRKVVTRKRNGRPTTVEINRPKEFGITWSEIEPVLLQHMAAGAEARLAKARDQATLDLVGDTTSIERETWGMKAAAVARYIASGDIDPLLQAEADAAGESVAELAARINDKATAWRHAVGQIHGTYRAARKRLREAETIAALKAAETAETATLQALQQA